MEHQQSNDHQLISKLKKECAAREKEIQQIAAKLQAKEKVQTVSSEENAQLEIYQAKEKVLNAQIKTINQTDVNFPEDPKIHEQLLLDELKQSVDELSQVLDLIQIQDKELSCDLDYVKQLNEEHKSVRNALKEKVDNLIAGPREVDDNALVQENVEKYTQYHSYCLEITGKMVSFVQKHFPPPTPQQTEEWLKTHGLRDKKRKKRSIGNDEAEEDEVPAFRSLQLLLEDLMNRCVHSPHDPYIQVDPHIHWQPYVHLLLRCRIALRHPDSANKIKLMPFHL